MDVEGSELDQIELYWWAFSEGNSMVPAKYRIPIYIYKIDITDEEIQSILQVETQEELQALFDAVDKNGDSEVTHGEVCRHYASLPMLTCSQLIDVTVTDPDYAAQQGPLFEDFW